MATSIFKEYFKGYEILGELGRGNARVLKARSIHTGELVAIKHFAFNSEPDALRRFQRESEIMKSIQHDYIVKIIEVHLDAELPYIVMQLIEGGDLRSLLRTYGTLDIGIVIRLAHHLTEALDAIHTRAVVHRDIKPENIMYRRLPTGETQFLLTDFGIAKLREQQDTITVTGSSMLTYDYASPEQFNQSKTVSTPTDYYSLGIVLYECLTGAVPFEFENDDLLLHINRVISCPLPVPQLPGGQPLPPSLLQLLEGLLAKQPLHRLSDPVSVRRLLRMAAVEDLQGEQAVSFALPAARRQTLNNPAVASSVRINPSPAPYKVKKHAAALNTFVLLLIVAAVFYSWKAVVKFKTDEPGPIATERELSPLVMEVKHSSQPVGGITSVSHPDYTPASILFPGPGVTDPATAPVPDQSSATAQANQGIPLINGIYYNDFSDQSDSIWNTGKDENSEYDLEDGKYVMKGFSDSLSYSSSVKFNMDIEKDFSISASTTHQLDSTGDPFGISFCGDEEQDSYFVFYITPNGFYSIGTATRGQWNVLVDWTESAHIQKDSELNVLTIEKHNDSIRFLINDKVEKVLPFTGGFGNYFGMRVDGAQTVAFDQFIVKGQQ